MNNKLFYNSIILSALLISNLAFAAPVGGTVVAGSATITQKDLTTNILQTSGSAVINWKGFDTASNETVNFNQPNSSSVILNRITSGLPTSFGGILTANGKVFIVNPAGMVFASESQVSAASVVATTADIKNEDFMTGNGRYKFFAQPGHEDARIINNGTIWSTDPYQGVVALIAPTVINTTTGVIAASDTVYLASGKAFVLDFNQDQLINFDASALVKSGYVKNAGFIQTTGDNGKVYMTTHTASKVLDSMISMSGVTEARNIQPVIGKNNEIILSSDEPQSGMIISSGGMSAKNVIANADTGIILGAPSGTFPIPKYISKNYGPGNLIYKTSTGNIVLNGSAWASDITMIAPKGAILEAKWGVIWANNLTTVSATGTNLDSINNAINNFMPNNSVSGGIYLKNYGSLENVPNVSQAAGGLKVESIGFWSYWFGNN